MKDVLYRAREEAEKALGEMVNKGFNNPSDLCCAKDAVKILTNVATIEAMERAQWTEEESRRMQRSMATGVPYGSSYTDPYWEQESMRRGRNALGQFTSRDMMPQSHMDYDRGYSGHSVNDIMIQSLERSITPDMNEVERQRIYDQIRAIRERKD